MSIAFEKANDFYGEKFVSSKKRIRNPGQRAKYILFLTYFRTKLMLQKSNGSISLDLNFVIQLVLKWTKFLENCQITYVH